MLVVCRVCASEYSIGTSRPRADACGSCDEEASGRDPFLRQPEWPLRQAGLRGERGLLRRYRPGSRPLWGRLLGRLIGFLRAPAFLAALAVAAMTTAVVARAALVTAIPQTAVLYAAAGLPVHLGGLALREATSTVETQDGQSVLVVQGRVENATSARLSVPPVTVTLRGARGEPVYRWNVPPARADLAAGEATSFRGRLAAPPSGAVDVELSMASRAEAVASGLR